MMNVLRARPLLVVVLIAAVGGVIFAWQHQGTSRSGAARVGARAIPVLAAPVTAKDVPIYRDGIGTVQAYNTVTVKSRVDGELLELAFREGQEVAAGAVLARLDPRTYKAQLDQAIATRDKDQAQLDAARVDLARYIGLGNRVSGQTVDTQRATVKQYEAAVKADQATIDNARAELSYTVISAPIAGRTGLRQVDVGNIVHASDSTGIVVLTQMQPIAVTFTLPQQNLRAVVDEMAKGPPLKVLAVESDNKTVVDVGHLELIDNQIDQATGTIKLKAVFPNEKRHLWPGGFINVRLLLTTRQGGLVVPAPAVQRGPNGTYVYVVDAGHKVAMRPVTVSVVEDDQALIDKGLDGSETVVVDGMGKLQEGATVSLATGDGAAGGTDTSAAGRDKAR